MPEATGLRRAWLDTAVRTVKDSTLGSMLPGGAAGQVLERVIQAGMMPFSLIEQTDK